MLLVNLVICVDKMFDCIFCIIKCDELSYWEFYEGWFCVYVKCDLVWWEWLIDYFIYVELLLFKLFVLFFMLCLCWCEDWVDVGEELGLWLV